MCGISIDDFTYLAEAIADNSGRDRTTCFGYATGWTQHTLGVQFIRTAAILQLLMGNVGRPGSGIMMAAAKTTDIADEELEPVADETASSARRVVAAYATDADECRMLLSMLGIAPGENA